MAPRPLRAARAVRAPAPPSPWCPPFCDGAPRGILRLVRRAPRRVLLLVDRHDAVHVAHVPMSSACVLAMTPQVVQLPADDCSRRGCWGSSSPASAASESDASGAGRPEPRRSFDAGALRTLFLFLSAAAAAAFSLRILLVSVNSASSFSAMVRSMFVPLLMCIL